MDRIGIRGGRMIASMFAVAVVLASSFGGFPAVHAQAPAGEHAAPFQLAPQQQQFIDQLLAAWEQQSTKIKTFECGFTRWEYMPLFGPKDENGQLMASVISRGELKYMQPDKGSFKVNEAHVWNPQTKRFDRAPAANNEHWICDGRVIWEMNGQKRQVIENLIPPEMQGRHIADGPLPFLLFGAEATKLKARYYLRERTEQRYAQEEIWLEAYPRWRNDAANFKNAQLIMKRAKFQPYALRLYSPNGKDYTVFEFTGITLNNVFFSQKSLSQPSVPRGWQLVRSQAPAVVPAAGQSHDVQTRADGQTPPDAQTQRPRANNPLR
jgi:TIGR03009 family protein